MSIPPPPPVHIPQHSPGREYTCIWCGTVSQGTDLTCPACGAAVDVQAVVSKSGWVELPAISDMARLQFGQSYCQIEGAYVPVADMNLAASDGVYFAHHVILWKDPGVTVTTLPLRGGWKRLFAGLPIIMTQAHGPGHIAFSQDRPGELVALPLQPGQAIDVREHTFMVATSQVAYDWFSTGIWFTTNEDNSTTTHYPVGQFMDRFVASNAPGLLLLHGGGNVFERRLAQGETMLVKPSALLFKDTTVGMQLHLERSRNFIGSWAYGHARHIWLRLFGPGRIAIESAYGHFEDPGRNLVSLSSATEWQW